MRIIVRSGLFAALAFAAFPAASFAQAGAGMTTGVTAGSAEAAGQNRLAGATREERLKTPPLDWRTNSGVPTPRKLTPAQEQALQNAPAGASGGGAPNPNADAEARRQFPREWAR